MIGGDGIGSSRQELEAAEAVAIDMGSLEDRGREEVGNLHGLLKILDEVNEKVGRCLDFRVLRKVEEEDSPWQRFGEVGEFVDTTEYDRHFIAMKQFPSMRDQPTHHWYFEEGMSPAVLVLERTSRSGATTPEKFSVLEKIREGMVDDFSYAMLEPFFTMQPSVALPRSGMKPADIIALMRRLGAVSAEGMVMIGGRH